MTEPISDEVPESPASYFDILRSLRPDERLTAIIDRVEEEMSAGPGNDRLAKYAKRTKK